MLPEGSKGLLDSSKFLVGAFSLYELTSTFDSCFISHSSCRFFGHLAHFIEAWAYLPIAMKRISNVPKSALRALIMLFLLKFMNGSDDPEHGRSPYAKQ